MLRHSTTCCNRWEKACAECSSAAAFEVRASARVCFGRVLSAGACPKAVCALPRACGVLPTLRPVVLRFAQLILIELDTNAIDWPSIREKYAVRSPGADVGRVPVQMWAQMWAACRLYRLCCRWRRVA